MENIEFMAFFFFMEKQMLIIWWHNLLRCNCL